MRHACGHLAECRQAIGLGKLGTLADKRLGRSLDLRLQMIAIALVRLQRDRKALHKAIVTLHDRPNGRCHIACRHRTMPFFSDQVQQAAEIAQRPRELIPQDEKHEQRRTRENKESDGGKNHFRSGIAPDLIEFSATRLSLTIENVCDTGAHNRNGVGCARRSVKSLERVGETAGAHSFRDHMGIEQLPKPDLQGRQFDGRRRPIGVSHEERADPALDLLKLLLLL